jgi:hypothetical protein
MTLLKGTFPFALFKVSGKYPTPNRNFFGLDHACSLLCAPLLNAPHCCLKVSVSIYMYNIWVCLFVLQYRIWVWVTLWLTIDQSVSQSVSQFFLALSPSGTYDQILAVVKTVALLLSWGCLPDGRTGLSCNRSQSLSVLRLYFVMFHRGIRGCIQKFLDWPPGARTATATRCSCIAILWVSLVSFAAVTVCVASQRVITKVSVYFIIDSVRKIWIHPRIFPLTSLFIIILFGLQSRFWRADCAEVQILFKDITAV